VSGGTGTLTNGPTYSTDGGGSIVFDGVDDRVNISNTNSYPQYTFGITMKRNTVPIYDFESFLFVNGQTNQALNRIGISINLRFNWRYRKTDGTFTTLQTGTNYVQLNEIAILHATYDGNDVKFYKNGILTNTFPSISFYDGWGGLTILGFNQSNDYYFNGNIYNFQLYNRPLSSSEILQNYQAEFPQILGENIITNGLVLYLDAGYTSSYPGTGTTWNNVSGVSGGTGTLTNGPTYDSANGGSIVFDGIDDKVDCGDPTSLRLSSTLTIQVIFYINSYNIWAGLIGKNNNLKSVYGLNLSPTSQRLRFNYNNISPWTNNVETTSTISTGQWIIASVTYDGENVRFYLNGVLDKTQYIGSVTFDTSAGYPLDIGWDNPGGDEYFNGKIAQAVIYNRALTQNEITQNFNAAKSRFGL
jgi:hypothetical protein